MPKWKRRIFILKSKLDSSDESKPPSAVIAAYLGELQSRADAVSPTFPTKDSLIQCQASSSIGDLHSNDVIIKTEEMPEILETNVSEKVTQSRRKPRKTQKVIKVEEKQRFTDDDEDLVEYISSPTGKGEGATVTTSVVTSPSQPVSLDSSVKTEANTSGDSAVQYESVQVKAEPGYLSSGKDAVPSKRRRMEPGCISSVIHCTACNCQIGVSARSAIYAHPILKVLICQKCYKWYVSDEIEKGVDGMDEQCRWCSEGGDLICCDFCHNAFCKSCIRRNLGRKALMDILNAGDASKWSCYVCDSKPILHLVEQCASIMDSPTTKSPKTPRLKGMHNKQKTGTQPKNAGFGFDQPFTTSNGSSIQLPSSMTNIRQRKPAGNSYHALNRGHFPGDTAEKPQGVVFLPSYSKTSFLPPFPGVGQLRGDVLDSAMSMQLASLTGHTWNYPTIDDSIEMLQKLDYLLSASTSLLNVLTSLQNELRFVDGRSFGLTPLVTERRRTVAARVWSVQVSYMKTFQNVAHQEMPVQEILPLGQQSYKGTFQRDIPELKRSGDGLNVGAGRQKFTRRNRRPRVETIDLT